VSRPRYIRFLSRAAPLYDPIVRGMGFQRLWRALAQQAQQTRKAGANPGEPCLDVCTGTGGAALALARAGATVVAVDAADGMLRRARRKAQDAELNGRVRLVRMNARSLAFADGTFPLVTCSMAVHEMSEPERDAVLAELRRVASDRVLVADYRVPRSRARGLLFRVSHAFEYLESDDFSGYTGRDMVERLEDADFAVEPPCDAGAYRIWPCRVAA
jgi:ubiquinone/menaquinone biosynthesis C-methylase UbiE